MDGHAELSFDTATNRINSPGWEYDAAGNQTRALAPAGGWLRYEYDAANRLVQVKADDNQSVVASYTYGSSNERLISEESGARTYYASEDGQVFAEYVEYGAQTTPQWTKSYVYLGRRLLTTFTATTNGEGVQHHHPDRLGTRLVTDPTNGTSFEQASLPFGNGLPSETSGATNRRFTSYDRSNATGLDYAVNRRYDSLQGRFTQADPIGVAAASIDDPQTLNLYAYCGNDPINHVDPSGLFFGKLFKWIGKALKWAVAAVAVVVAVAVIVAALSAPGSPGAAFASFLWNSIAVPAIKALAALTGVKGVGAGFGPGGTAVWNPNAGSGIGSGRWRQYVFHQNDDERITITTNCPRVGTTPLCPGTGRRGVGQPGTLESLIPIWGSGRAAVDHFQNGRWGWGIVHTVLAITDVFLVKSAITAGGKLLVKGGARALAEEGTHLAGTNAAKEWLGEGTRVITNPAGDKVFLSRDG